MATANMGLTLPDVSVTPGPTWASQINSDLTLIDQHNHTDTNGAPIPTAGLNIDAELKFNNTAPNGLPATGLSRLGLLAPQTPPLATGVYSDVSGDLYYDNGAVQVQITSGSNIVGTAGSISGMTPESSASFNGGTGTFLWQKDAALSQAATMDHGPLRLRDGTSSANAITITPPSGLASAYTLTLPSALPGQQSLLGTSTGGAQSNVAVDSTLALTSSLLKVANLGVGTAQLADASVATAKLASNAVTTIKIADGVVTQPKWGAKSFSYSSSIVSASTSSSTLSPVSSGGVYLATSSTLRAGHTVRVEMLATGAGISSIDLHGYDTLDCEFDIEVLTPTSTTLTVSAIQIKALASTATSFTFSPSSVCALYTPTVNGSHFFSVLWKLSDGSSVSVNNVKLVVYEA